MKIAEIKFQPNNFQVQGVAVTVTQAYDEKSGMGKNGKAWMLRSMMVADDSGESIKLTWWSPTIHDVSLIAGNQFYINKCKVHHNQYNGQVQVELQCSGNEMVHQSMGGMQAPAAPVAASMHSALESLHASHNVPVTNMGLPAQSLGQLAVPQPVPCLTPGVGVNVPTKLTDLQMLEKMRQYSTILRSFLPEREVQSAIATLVISCQKGQCTMTPLDDPNDLSGVIPF